MRWGQRYGLVQIELSLWIRGKFWNDKGWLISLIQIGNDRGVFAMRVIPWWRSGCQHHQHWHALHMSLVWFCIITGTNHGSLIAQENTMTTIGSKGITGGKKRWNWFIGRKVILSNYWSEERKWCGLLDDAQALRATTVSLNWWYRTDKRWIRCDGSEYTCVDYLLLVTYYPNDDWMGGGLQ